MLIEFLVRGRRLPVVVVIADAALAQLNLQRTHSDIGGGKPRGESRWSELRWEAFLVPLFLVSNMRGMRTDEAGVSPPYCTAAAKHHPAVIGLIDDRDNLRHVAVVVAFPVFRGH